VGTGGSAVAKNLSERVQEMSAYRCTILSPVQRGSTLFMCLPCMYDAVSFVFVPPKTPICTPGMLNAEEVRVSTDALSSGGDEGRGLLCGRCVVRCGA
jgi:hypothetical protein